MKKLIVSALALTLISFASVQADNTLKTAGVMANSAYDSQEKVSVKPESLPDGVKKTIASDAFSGWKVISAFLVTNTDKTQYYELNVKNGDESARVKLDKDGNNVE
ncbi:hypothetical protein [Dyadobacter sp. CY312]|uniref:hypothetical protein n=1 Tax=Dyadobacter sp. CY312 TaxID=2907303 RepID=UPI001F3F51E5|nr:hypothetical protein [Dyadobacter sp. CY312]MCE7038812.1 hypothetical protein [Dyadobacter sp. CY312]